MDRRGCVSAAHKQTAQALCAFYTRYILRSDGVIGVFLRLRDGMNCAQFILAEWHRCELWNGRKPRPATSRLRKDNIQVKGKPGEQLKGTSGLNAVNGAAGSVPSDGTIHYLDIIFGGGIEDKHINAHHLFYSLLQQLVPPPMSH